MIGFNLNNLKELDSKETNSINGGAIPLWGRLIIGIGVQILGKREAHAPGLPRMSSDSDIDIMDIGPELTPCDAV